MMTSEHYTTIMNKNGTSMKWMKVTQGITEARAEFTDRLEVPGGWLYRTIVNGRVALAFVPDAWARSE